MKFRATIPSNITNNCSILVLEHLTFLRDVDFFAKRSSGLYLQDLNSVAKTLAFIRTTLPTFRPILLKVLLICSKPLLLRSAKDSLLYQTDVVSLFTQLGRLLEVKNSDIHRSVLHAVKFHLTDSTHFIVSCIEASCFIEKLCKFLRFPVCMEAKAEALDVFRRLADKCTSTLVNSLECEGVATLCTEVPDKSVLMVNETLSVVLLHCLDGKLLVKAGEDVSRSLLDFLIFRIPQYLHTQHRLSPSRKILHQKAAIGNLLVLLSSVNEGNAGLVCGDIETLLHQLTTLVNRKDKSKEHLDLLCSYLSVLSMLDGAIASKALLDIAIDATQPVSIRKQASLCLSHHLLRNLKGMSDGNGIRSLFSGIDKYFQCFKDSSDLMGAAVHLCLSMVIGGNSSTQNVGFCGTVEGRRSELWN